MKRTDRITAERHRAVLAMRVCPGCNDYVVIDVVRRSKKDVMSRDSKFLGKFHCCGGPDGHKCWHMSSFSEDKPMYETFGDEEGSET